jgi:ADP-L-glycero-D-manno-heptose 6-epimerase
MIIGLTGANGFIGRNLYIQLAKNHEIYTFDHTGNHRDPYQLIQELNKGKKIDLILHFGANSDAQVVSLQKNVVDNLGYTYALACAAASSSTNFIFASSAAVYGNGNSSNLSPYAHTKYVSEKNIQNLSLDFPHWQHLSIRLSNIFGQDEVTKGKMMSVPTKFILDAIESQKIEVWSQIQNGIQITPSRDFLHVLDLIKILENLISRSSWEFDVIDVGSGSTYSFLEIGRLIQSFIPTDIQIVPMPNSVNTDYYQMNTKADLGKLHSMGVYFEPSDLSQSLKSMIKANVLL